MALGTEWRDVVVRSHGDQPDTSYEMPVIGAAELNGQHPECPSDPEADTVDRDGEITYIRGSAALQGCDAFRVRGYIRDWQPAREGLTVHINGEQVNPDEQFPEPLPGSPPVAEASITGDGMNVTLDGSPSRDPDGQITGYLWTIAGEEREGQTVNYTFQSEGTFPVNLTVTDNDGRRASADYEVTTPVEEEQPQQPGQDEGGLGDFFWGSRNRRLATMAGASVLLAAAGGGVFGAAADDNGTRRQRRRQR